MQIKSVNVKGNIETVKEAYAAFASNDIACLLSLIDSEVEWDHPASSKIPWAGNHRGHAGVKTFFGKLTSTLEFEAFEPRAFFVNGSAVVVLGFERLCVKKSRQRYETHWTHAFIVEDGKITRFREYTDTGLIADSLRDVSPE